MGTTQSFQPSLPETADAAAVTSQSSGFWTGVPKVLAGLATILGSIVALITVLVQAGVIGAPGDAEVPPQQTVAVAKTPAAGNAVAELNGLLTESARTKGNLGTLVARVQAEPPALARATALRAIEAIVEQREQLHARLSSFDAPSPLSKSLALLRDAITASLADDRLVRQWIVARYARNGAEDQLWEAQLEASRAATAAKDSFRTEYAAQLASNGLPSVIPDY